MLASTEQIDIGRCIENNKNLIITAAPGSGKSTVILSTAMLCDDKVFLALTYNASLKFEVREKIVSAKLKNIAAHSYHSLCVQYYHPQGFDDIVLTNLINYNKKPVKPLPPIDVIAIDECQDMTFLYYSFIHKVIRDLPKMPQIMLMGDSYQDLYGFKGADKRYLLLGNRIFNHSFEQLTLSKTFRLTGNITKFVNRTMIGCERIKAVKEDGEKVWYIRDSNQRACDKVVKDIVKLLCDGLIWVHDIFVLAASTKNKMLRLLENNFVSQGIDCYVSTNDEGKLDDDIMMNKALFTSFHQAKGMERKVVIIVGFDGSYFKYYAKNLEPTICPPPMYVGSTRASFKLYVVENKLESKLPFLQLSHKEMDETDYIEFFGTYDDKEYVIRGEEKMHTTSPTDLVRFLSNELICELMHLMKDMFDVIQHRQYILDIPKKVKFDTWEEVSDLNGIIIPAMYEHKMQKTNSLFKYICDADVSRYELIKDVVKDIKEPTMLEDYVKLGVVYHAVREKLYFKLEQIKKYDWLTEEVVNLCLEGMKIIGDKCNYEIELSYTSKEFHEIGNVVVNGYVDAMNEDDIYEFKCVDDITMEHKLQLIVYAWMMINTNQKEKKYKLFNIKTGEILQLNISSKINIIVEKLLRNKYQEQTTLDDNAFIEKCNKVHKK